MGDQSWAQSHVLCWSVPRCACCSLSARGKPTLRARCLHSRCSYILQERGSPWPGIAWEAPEKAGPEQLEPGAAQHTEILTPRWRSLDRGKEFSPSLPLLGGFSPDITRGCLS